MSLFCGALALILITLKLTGFIAISWWLVLLPLYGGTVLLLAVASVFYAVAYLMSKRGPRFRTGF